MERGFAVLAENSGVLVVIPARLASKRLPRKPLLPIAGRPMIVHVLERAQEAALGPVVVATDSTEIASAIGEAGGTAVMTRSDHPSGSDRVFEAVENYDAEGRFEIIVNLQGDLPLIEPHAILTVAGLMVDGEADIGTLVNEITEKREVNDPNVVKAVLSPLQGNRFRALYFTRATAPAGDGPLYHHIGIYAFRRNALSRFIGLPLSPLETREKLEQLRALEAGMRIDAALVDIAPLGVDTPADLQRVRNVMGKAQPAKAG